MTPAAHAGFADKLRADFDSTFAQPARQAHAGMRDFVLVATGSTLWALPLEGLRAIEHGLVLVPVPSSRPALLGLAGVRSVVVPVFDLGALLGRTPEASSPVWRHTPAFALIDVTPAERAGIAFERLLQFARVSEDSLHQPSSGNARATLHHEEEAYTVVEAAELSTIIRMTEHAQDGDTTR